VAERIALPAAGGRITELEDRPPGAGGERAGRQRCAVDRAGGIGQQYTHPQASNVQWRDVQRRLALSRPEFPKVMMVGSFRAGRQDGVGAQSGSAQSIRPSQSSSIKLLQFSGAGTQGTVVVVVLAVMVVLVEDDAVVVELPLATVVVGGSPVRSSWTKSFYSISRFPFVFGFEALAAKFQTKDAAQAVPAGHPTPSASATIAVAVHPGVPDIRRMLPPRGRGPRRG
jgi:hypothetical protein